MDKNTLEFVTFCIGKLSLFLKLPQHEYIVPSYDVLHTFSSRYLVEDIVEFMKEKGVLET